MSSDTQLAIGVVLTGVQNLSQGGGAERYFADIVRAGATHASLDLTLAADATTLAALAKVGREIPPENVLIAPSSRVQQARWFANLATSGRFDVLHLAQATPRHLPWLALKRFNRSSHRRTRVSININDTRIAYRPPLRQPRMDRLTLALMFRSGGVDGVMSWYKAAFNQLPFPEKRPAILHAARHCFVNASLFSPAPVRQSTLVFCSRFVPEKQPVRFVDAVAHALSQLGPTGDTWRIVMFGGGTLDGAVEKRITALGMQRRIDRGDPNRLAETLASARLFCSTQDHENFTSLAMLEAMASGCAIISRNVGQTGLFVRDNLNGKLVPPNADAVTIGNALAELMARPHTCDELGRGSRMLVEREHNESAVLSEFLGFWQAVRNA